MSPLLGPQRPSSRSERMLRETLRRDGEVRDSSPGMTSPPRRPSMTRRHTSRVSSPASPVLPTATDLYSRSSSPSHKCRYAELADEQYTRGTFLFRSAITNAPNSPLLPQKMECRTSSSDGTATPVAHGHPRWLNKNGPHSPARSSQQSSRSTSPSPPASTKSGSTRRHSLQRSFYHEPRTPQEHALRARLDNYIEDNRQAPQVTKPSKENACMRCNEVGVPARQIKGSRSVSVSQPHFVPSSSPRSSFSSHSGPSSTLPQEHRTFTHTRSRSSTDPARPSSTSSRARTSTYTTSPTLSTTSTTSSSNMSPTRRSIATPNSLTHSPQPQLHMPSYTAQLSNQSQLSRKKRTSMETTPPLTADVSPTGISEGNELEPDDSRLITPPPSPPPSHHNSNASRKSHHHNHHHHHLHSPSPYRPIGEWNPSLGVTSVEDDSSLHPHALANHLGRGQPHALPHAHSPSQFNVRKASEQCKMIDGYVSFLSIEGLGGPPGSDSPAIGDEEEEGENQNREKRMMFGIGWNGLKKLLPLAVVGAVNSPSNAQEAAA